MNVNQPNRSASRSSAATARARIEEAPASGLDGNLGELVRSLCALVADSPERQAKIQGLMRAYAAGNLKVDAEATAGAIVDDAVRPHLARP